MRIELDCGCWIESMGGGQEKVPLMQACSTFREDGCVIAPYAGWEGVLLDILQDPHSGVLLPGVLLRGDVKSIEWTGPASPDEAG
ncbi:MAG: hypothetical protein V3V08_23375 [Nannocystaceae bacterium]